MAIRITTQDLVGLSPAHTQFVVEYTKDFAARRAAEASGFAPDYGYRLLEHEDIKQAITAVLKRRQEKSDLDAEWLMWEAVDNHMIARQQGNITASNTALALLAKHKMIDAMATQNIQLDVTTDREKVERLQRGRKRVNQLNQGTPADHIEHQAEIDDLTPSEPPPVSFF